MQNPALVGSEQQRLGQGEPGRDSHRELPAWQTETEARKGKGVVPCSAGKTQS